MQIQKKLLRSIFVVTLILGLAVTVPTSSQEVTSDTNKLDWIKDHAIPINSTEILSNDFSDLMPLIEKIGNARVVMLGEQTHGDGTVFLLKGRLIRFLHEKMGFDILAWESGLFGCREVNRALATDCSLEEAYSQGIFGIWGKSAQVRPLLEYARKTLTTTHPLRMAGFDCQISGKSEWTMLPAKLIDLFDSTDPSLLSEEQRTNIKKIPQDQTFIKSPEEERVARLDFYKSLARIFNSALPRLTRSHSQREIGFWKRVIDNLPDFFSVYDILARAQAEKRMPTAGEITQRDISMGENLAWLANEYYAGQKIIVWAATSHCLRDPQAISFSMDGKASIYKDYITMGQTAFAHLGNDLYTIAFTAFSGKIGFANRDVPQTEISPAPEGSLPALLHQDGRPILFLDFRTDTATPGHWLQQEYSDRPLGHSIMKTAWARQYDAVIFTDLLEPSTPWKQ